MPGHKVDVFSAANTLRIVFIILGAVFFAILIAFVAILLVKRSKSNHLMSYFNKKLCEIKRNEFLDREIKRSSIPISKNYWLIRVVEINQFGEKDHFFNLSEEDFTIGKDFSKNKLYVFDEGAEKVHCKIVFNKEVPGFMNLAENCETVFTFKKKHGRAFKKGHKMRTGETVRLYSFDTVMFGETKLVFYVFNNNLGIVWRCRKWGL